MSREDVYQILYLIRKDGNSPFRKWLKALDVQSRMRVNKSVRKIALGNFGDWKNVGKGVFELRLHFGPGYRIYFAKVKDVLVVLIAGGTKKTQEKDIKKAQELLREYKDETGTF